MDESKGREAEIEQLKQATPGGLSIVAVHESGHAVARFLTAFDLPYESDKLGSLVVERRVPMCSVPRGRMPLC